nr:MAG: glycoprotein [Dichorhavirus sp. 'monocotyledonae']
MIVVLNLPMITLGMILIMFLNFLISLLLQAQTIISLSILPTTVCEHERGIHLEEWRHLCLGACESTDVSADMSKFLIMMPTIEHHKAYAYKMDIYEKKISSHVSFFGSCHRTQTVTKANARDVPDEDIREILGHGGPGGTIDHTSDPACDWMADNHISGFVITYKRVLVEVSKMPDGNHVVFPQYGVSVIGDQGTHVSDNILFAWDLSSQLPKCEYRPVGSTFCKQSSSGWGNYYKCRGEDEIKAETETDDCGLKVLHIDDGSHLAIPSNAKISRGSTAEESYHDLFNRVLDIEGILCHHLCQSSEEDNILAHEEYLITTPIGDWLSVHTDHHRILFRCQRDMPVSLIRPINICGNGPYLQVMLNAKPVWWNINSPYINPSSQCVPSMSTSLVEDGVISTWLGKVKVNGGNFTFKSVFKDVPYHPAFRPMKRRKSQADNSLEDTIKALLSVSKVTYKKQNIKEERISMGRSIGDNAKGLLDKAGDWFMKAWDSVKGWGLKILLLVLIIITAIFIIWVIILIIKAIIKRFSNKHEVVHETSVRYERGSDTSLVEWAKNR